MSDKTYCYPPHYTVLKNKLGIRDAATLDAVESEVSFNRMRQGVPNGGFDLAHLRSIHKHLFQDIYDWAGEIRTVTLAKGTSHFIPPNRIEMGMQDVSKRLADQNHLAGLSASQFAKQAGTIIGDVNHIHPFREGNGRTQFQYLKQLGAQAGHIIDLSRFERKTWMAASIAAHETDYAPMGRCIANAITQGREKDTLQSYKQDRQTSKNPDRDTSKDRGR